MLRDDVQIVAKGLKFTNKVDEPRSFVVDEIIYLVSVNALRPVMIEYRFIAVQNELFKCRGSSEDVCLKFVQWASGIEFSTTAVDHRPPRNEAVPWISDDRELEVGVPDCLAIKRSEFLSRGMFFSEPIRLSEGRGYRFAACFLNMHEYGAVFMANHR